MSVRITRADQTGWRRAKLSRWPVCMEMLGFNAGQVGLKRPQSATQQLLAADTCCNWFLILYNWSWNVMNWWNGYSSQSFTGYQLGVSTQNRCALAKFGWHWFHHTCLHLSGIRQGPSWEVILGLLNHQVTSVPQVWCRWIYVEWIGLGKCTFFLVNMSGNRLG